MTATLFAQVVLPELDLEQPFDVLVEGSEIACVTSSGTVSAGRAVTRIDGGGKWLLPGFIDDHVHLREPGLEHKEGFASGTRAAAAGGVTTLLEIQNNPPLLTHRGSVQDKLERVRPKAAVNIGVYGSLVPDALGHVGEMSELVAGYKLFMGPSTGGLEVQGEEHLRRAFAEVASTGHWLFVHAEDGDLVADGLARHGQDGATAFHRARPAAAEIAAVEQAIRIATEEGTRVHLFHLSTAGAVDLVADARRSGKPVTAGTCPHYLYFTHEDTARLGTLLKVNPSIKTAADRDRLLAGLKDGTVDCLSSDHAPHTAEEKGRPFPAAPAGIPSLDIFMPLCLTLARRGLLDLKTVLARAARTPAQLHGFSRKGRVAEGFDADLVLVDADESRTVRGADHFSRARWTPYEGMELVGWPQLTMVMGQVVFRAG